MKIIVMLPLDGRRLAVVEMPQRLIKCAIRVRAAGRRKTSTNAERGLLTTKKREIE